MFVFILFFIPEFTNLFGTKDDGEQKLITTSMSYNATNNNNNNRHLHQFVYNRKMCRIYIVLPKNDLHQSVYNYVNLPIYYSNRVNLHWQLTWAIMLPITITIISIHISPCIIEKCVKFTQFCLKMTHICLCIIV